MKMKVIQGCYAGKIESKKGKLKGLRIATEKGDTKVYLPKSLRAIAQAELTLNEPVRVWLDGDRTSKKKLYALQLVPLAPKSTLLPTERSEATDAEAADAEVVSDLAIAQAVEAEAEEAEAEKAKAEKAEAEKAKAEKAKTRKTKAEKTKANKSLDKQKTKKKGSQKSGKSTGKQSKKKTSQVTVQICQKKNCCKKGGDDLWEAFESASAEHPFKLEPIGCLGGCKRGPNIRLLPDNVKYRHVQLAEIDGILQTHRA